MKVPTPNLIKLQYIDVHSEMLHDRIMEITGERTTLETKFKFGEINETLFYMKLKCLDYEMKNVIQPKIDSLNTELELLGILMNLNLQLSEN